MHFFFNYFDNTLIQKIKSLSFVGKNKYRYSYYMNKFRIKGDGLSHLKIKSYLIKTRLYMFFIFDFNRVLAKILLIIWLLSLINFYINLIPFSSIISITECGYEKSLFKFNYCTEIKKISNLHWSNLKFLNEFVIRPKGIDIEDSEVLQYFYTIKELHETNLHVSKIPAPIEFDKTIKIKQAFGDVALFSSKNLFGELTLEKSLEAKLNTTYLPYKDETLSFYISRYPESTLWVDYLFKEIYEKSLQQCTNIINLNDIQNSEKTDIEFKSNSDKNLFKMDTAFPPLITNLADHFDVVDKEITKDSLKSYDFKDIMESHYKKSSYLYSKMNSSLKETTESFEKVHTHPTKIKSLANYKKFLNKTPGNIHEIE